MMWIYLVIAGLIASPLIVELTRKKMNASAREGAPGQFATLSQGVTHYRWFGPEEGPVIVCIHGLTTPSFVWDGLAPGLADLGYRVLSYDLLGRGYSDRPRGVQDAAFFQRQLADLLDDQNVDDDVTLIGYSMGGAIAAAYGADQPYGLRQIVLLAPAGMEKVEGKLMQFIVRTPVVGTWLMLEFYATRLRKGLMAEKELPTSVPNITDLQDAELNWQGFVLAVLASLRGILNHSMEEEHRKLHAEDVPVLAIWGQEDSVIPLSASEKLVEWNPGVRNEVIEGAGHGLTYTHTPQVLALITEFSQQQD